jgi:hypothetical protein
MTQAETQHYWQTMRKAMERAGDTTSAIYKRALELSQGRPDPNPVGGASEELA